MDSRAIGRVRINFNLLLLAVLSAVVMLLPTRAQAQTATPTLTPTPRNVTFAPPTATIAAIGGSTSVALSIDNASGVLSFQFTINYTAAIVTATGASLSAGATGAGCFHPPSMCRRPGRPRSRYPA